MDVKKGAGDKQKDPYYFTFFNEKNEAKKVEAGDMTPEVISSAAKKKQNHIANKGNITSTSMITDNSQDEQLHSALSREGDASHNSRKMPSKPTFKKKSDSRTEASALSTQNMKDAYIRETQNNSQISQKISKSTKPIEEQIQVQKQMSTPQKDIGIKNKFESSKDATYGYQTLD